MHPNNLNIITLILQHFPFFVNCQPIPIGRKMYHCLNLTDEGTLKQRKQAASKRRSLLIINRIFCQFYICLTTLLISSLVHSSRSTAGRTIFVPVADRAQMRQLALTMCAKLGRCTVTRIACLLSGTIAKLASFRCRRCRCIGRV